jgi:hypothetical protein
LDPARKQPGNSLTEVESEEAERKKLKLKPNAGEGACAPRVEKRQIRWMSKN